MRVVVREITELRYEIDAKTPKEAVRIWRESEDGGKRGEPEESIVDHELEHVVDDKGNQIDACPDCACLVGIEPHSQFCSRAGDSVNVEGAAS